MTHEQREQLKTEAHETLSNPASTLEEKKAALLKIIRAHYERSKESWKGKGSTLTADRDGPGVRIVPAVAHFEPHGDWPSFVASWLHASRDRLDIAPAEVFAELQKEFPAPAKPMIGPGRSYWGTR
jgi:hypothetical protein